jgi:hypothetical protein
MYMCLQLPYWHSYSMRVQTEIPTWPQRKQNKTKLNEKVEGLWEAGTGMRALVTECCVLALREGVRLVIAANTSKPAHSRNVYVGNKSFIATSWNWSVGHLASFCWYTFGLYGKAYFLHQRYSYHQTICS